MRKLLDKAKEAVFGLDIVDLHVYGGIGLIYYGLSGISNELYGLSVAGLMVFWLGVRK